MMVPSSFTEADLSNHAVLLFVPSKIRIQPEINKACREGEEHDADQAANHKQNAVFAGRFSNPYTMILHNNCSPHSL